jgi:hypothetical protein
MDDPFLLSYSSNAPKITRFGIFRYPLMRTLNKLNKIFEKYWVRRHIHI